MRGLLFLLQLGVATFDPPNRQLRDAQARFETVRRMHLPIYHSGGYRCDTRIGRFCYWYDSSPPPALPEPAPIREGRERLLRALAEAQRQEKGAADGWIAGQRVRYLLDAGRPDSAARLECGAERWWCLALQGLAWHAAGQDGAADSAFTASLALMPPGQRCDWMDPVVLLEGPLRRELERSPCPERERLADRLFRLAQPLWMTGGSDVRSEHLSRRVMDVILQGSAIPHGFRWGDDTRELLLRYGWSEVYTRSPPEVMSSAAWTVLGHDREPSWHLFPRLESARARWVTATAWDLRDPAARTRYSPRHLTALLDLPHELVRVPLGDSMLVAAAIRWSGMPADSVTASLGILAPSLRLARATGGIATLVVPRDTVLVSIEALERRSRRGARSRYAVAPLACAERWCMSDLVLYAGEDGGGPVSLEHALARALPMRVSRDSALGVWWHLRGSGQAEGPVVMRLTLEPSRPNPIRRVAERLGLTRTSSAVRLRWQVAQRADSVSSHVVLRFPERARGRYRLTLSAQAPEGARVHSVREVELAP